jgi:hypothetical protein
MDDEALIRRTAVENVNPPDLKKRVTLIAPLLFDPVKAVRIEAARRLADEPSKSLAPDQRKMFERDLHEFEAAMEYTADFPSSRTPWEYVTSRFLCSHLYRESLSHL